MPNRGADDIFGMTPSLHTDMECPAGADTIEQSVICAIVNQYPDYNVELCCRLYYLSRRNTGNKSLAHQGVNSLPGTAYRIGSQL